MVVAKLIYVLVAVIVIATVAIPICMIDTADHPNSLAVIMIEGQSNGTYDDTGIDEMNDRVPIPKHKVLYYGDEDRPIRYRLIGSPTYDDTFESYGIHSMVEDGQWKVGTSDAAIAYCVAKNCNIDVLVINASMSGAAIDNLLPGHVGGEYEADVLSHALADITGYDEVIMVGFVWIQGEANSSTPVDTYISKFDEIMAYNNTLGFDKCYMVQTRPANGGNASIAQLQICKDRTDVILASTAPATFTVANGLLKDDNLHWTGEGRYIVGMDVGAKIHIDGGGNPLLLIIPVILIAAVIFGIIGYYSKGE